MQVIFQKTSHATHGLLCVRDDGTKAEVTALESKSYLRHDLMHYCVEKHAGLMQSFFGLLATGKNFEELRAMDEMPKEGAGEAYMTERIVAMLQGSHHEEAFHADQTFTRIADSFSLQDEVPPPYFTESFVSSAVSEFRFLLKRWDSLPTGEQMELIFPG